MKFIVKSNNGIPVAVLTCSDHTDFKTGEEFIERLKKAMVQWTTRNDGGKHALKVSEGSFTLADFIDAYPGEPPIKNILASNGIFSFTMETINSSAIELKENEILVSK
jgi:hypothetical protein